MPIYTCLLTQQPIHCAGLPFQGVWRYLCEQADTPGIKHVEDCCHMCAYSQLSLMLSASYINTYIACRTCITASDITPTTSFLF